jgi:hypothetical protein
LGGDQLLRPARQPRYAPSARWLNTNTPSERSIPASIRAHLRTRTILHQSGEGLRIEFHPALWIIAAILCVALCAYGITTAVGPSKDRRDAPVDGQVVAAKVVGACRAAKTSRAT